MKLSFIINKIDEPDELKYEPWKITDNEYTEDYPSWILYTDGKPVAGLSNDSDDKNNVIIRHIEALKPGCGCGTKLLKKLLKKGISIQTGEPNYNSISPPAHKLFKKIHKLAKKLGIKSKMIGPANNDGCGYDDLENENVQHYKWKKE